MRLIYACSSMLQTLLFDISMKYVSMYFVATLSYKVMCTCILEKREN